MSKSPTPLEVTTWMASQVGDEYLYQETVVHEISERFGAEFTREKESGNPAVAKTVLSAFRELTQDTVVWDQSERAWRKRNQFDVQGRRQES